MVLFLLLLIVAVALGVIGALARGTLYVLIIGVMVLIADLVSSERGWGAAAAPTLASPDTSAAGAFLLVADRVPSGSPPDGSLTVTGNSAPSFTLTSTATSGGETSRSSEDDRRRK